LTEFRFGDDARKIADRERTAFAVRGSTRHAGFALAKKTPLVFGVRIFQFAAGYALAHAEIPVGRIAAGSAPFFRAPLEARSFEVLRKRNARRGRQRQYADNE